MSSKFIRTDYQRFLRLGKKRRKLQVWRRARGRHSKIRRKRRGYPVMPTVGYRTPRKEANKINGLYPKLVHNFNDLSKIGKTETAILSSKIGAKKKLEMIKKASEMNVKILNLGA